MTTTPRPTPLTAAAGALDAAKKRERRLRLATRHQNHGPDSPTRAQEAEALATAALTLARNHAPEAGRIASFISTDDEPPTHSLNATLTAAGYDVITPVTNDDMTLNWLPYDPNTPPAVRTRDLTDTQRAALLGPEAITSAPLLLIPGIAVDLKGNRLGHGGGCYDRTLTTKHPEATVIVVLHEGEISTTPLPHGRFDQPVNGILTASGHQFVPLTAEEPSLP
ncbi:5-formyltetrahydrofolate cyclo-ligase [Dermatophilus congolensis]|uniref:5-formyltetrahydrofolate cyclo-ligase n=1 Tax=Dermatophilus congolensis TaxID=1863 RepID=A0A239V5T5_9MICO|nr:5-formyltetrahydrofolate cyclo-ligase [Dermatophilus congolensis]MBO3130149.1 5-formyltetrahydrofolate cyclo-ligase [Dermatophilus congolensis]MBO3131224.1 5-formyltetrahydrofolate cyclo-ligase [Dermatophilus congolensis]MBO3134620.1 5-formyltetrahydrofolate cyclo-ligase [Dermatophilus congolensis]MBO3136857.1 5-formyltetrahydrofolate cyclo-ligase [Dermatophilus congolensis]MBO3139101.1 5-formyltetrahydrofolate cyclo-ligase [Dermatophilus congolensis]